MKFETRSYHPVEQNREHLRCQPQPVQAAKAIAIGCAAMLLIASCGGGDGSGTDPVSDPDRAPELPTIGTDGNVVWPSNAKMRAVDSTRFVDVSVFARIPGDSDGVPPRLNVMATTGSRILVGSERDGRLYELDSSGNASLWFDLAQAMQSNGDRLDDDHNWHSGLRSLAFHPDFASNGRFYTSLMAQRPVDPTQFRYLSDVSDPIIADSMLVEWQADPATLVVDPASYRPLFRVGMPTYDHTIKQIVFGPDGYLYIAHGDGSVKSATAGGGQNLNDALGKILRINPLQNSAMPYSIPPDNPFAAVPNALSEIFSFGHRNPHHLAFTSSGMLLAAEPGRDNIDEINIIVGGKNYGWSQREGTYVHLAGGGLLNGLAPLPSDDANFGFVYPAVQYGHVAEPGAGFIGQALGGGYAVENGSSLSGNYFFCDFATVADIYFSTLSDLASVVTQGNPGELSQATMFRAVIRFDHDSDPGTPAQNKNSMLEIIEASATYDGNGRADIRYGQGPDGTLYLMSKRNGTIYRIDNSRPGS